MFGILGALAVLPAAWNGLQTEDHHQRLLGWTTHIYPLLRGDVVQNYYAKDAGALPWIASEDLKVAFFRPLSSLSLSFDYQVLPAGQSWPYVQSFLWLSVLITGAAALFRRINGTWGAGAVASVLFAVDDAHGLAVGWLAARHTLLAGALAVLAVVLFDYWRRDGSKAAKWSCPLVLLLALLSSEFAASVIGYFIAYTLFLDRALIKDRLAASVAYWMPLGVWMLMYILGGYGARGSGMYISAVDEPITAARAVLFRLPWLLTGTFGIGSADVGSLPTASAHASWSLVAWLIAAVIFALLSPVIRRSRAARFWAAGMLLSSVPLCSSPPTDRLLLLLAISGMALADILIGEVRAGVGSRWWRRAAAALAAMWILAHGVVAPLHLGATTRALTGLENWLESAVATTCADVKPNQQLIIVQSPSYYAGTMMTQLLRMRGCRASHIRVLFGGLGEPTGVRTSATTLLIHADEGFLAGPLDRVYRSEARPFAVGQGLQLSALQIIIAGITETGAPKDVKFRFAWPLEDDRLRFVAWDGQRYSRFELPPIGEERRLKAFVPGQDAKGGN